MRLMFFYNVGKDVGSAQTVHNYCRVAKALSHEIAIYGPSHLNSGLTYSLEAESADAVIFVFEWWLEPHYAGLLNLVRLVSKVPRQRRIVIDDDGMYNDVIQVGGDYNHLDAAGSRARIELFDSLSDKILQPTLHPLRPNVRSFLFHGYNPAWERPLDFGDKEYGMFYVGNNWFRWRGMQRVLKSIEPIREQVGRIGIAGYGWEEPAQWVEPALRMTACYTDPAYLQQVGVELLRPVLVEQVVETMSKGISSPVLVRPLFNHLRLVSPRMFETPSAGTVPLFGLDPRHVQEIYGSEALELVLAEAFPEEKILDIVRRPGRYSRLVQGIRRHLAEHHSYEARLKQLIETVKD